MAQLKRTEFGKVNLDYVLGIGGFDLERIESAMDDEGEKEDHEHRHDHHHDHDEKHDHNHGSKGLGSKKVHFEAIWGTFGHGLDSLIMEQRGWTKLKPCMLFGDIKQRA